jgi:molybdenum cofactor biosynthesis protein B
MDSSQWHRQQADARGPVPVGIVTVSDTRTMQTDVNGAALRSWIEDAGHRVAHAALIPDDPARVLDALESLAAAGCRIAIFNGGTGIGRRDTTYDVLAERYEKILPGFGELFRMLSYDQVGAAAMLSRASAGLIRGMVVLSVPGSPQAVALAWERLIGPELTHLAWEVVR